MEFTREVLAGAAENNGLLWEKQRVRDRITYCVAYIVVDFDHLPLV